MVTVQLPPPPLALMGRERGMEMEMELWERRRNNINEMETGQSMLRGKINNNCVMTRGRKRMM